MQQGRSDGVVYRDIYPPPNQSTLNFLCGCFVSLTQDKFDIVQFIPPQIRYRAIYTPQIKFLATPPLCRSLVQSRRIKLSFLNFETIKTRIRLHEECSKIVTIQTPKQH